LIGYKIYYKKTFSGPLYNGRGVDQGASPINIPLNHLDDPSDPRYTLTGLADQKSYYLTVTAIYDETPPRESSFSNEASLIVDHDNDQMPDDLEVYYGLNPGDPDSDQDGMGDWFEWSYLLMPLDSSDATADADRDGFTNFQEYLAGTNPQNGSSIPPVGVPALVPLGLVVSLVTLLVLGVTRIRRQSQFRPTIGTQLRG
jgi:hypothetical protein